MEGESLDLEAGWLGRKKRKAKRYSYSANLGVKTQVSLGKTVIADTLKS